MTPTLALLLGVPIPLNSLGVALSQPLQILPLHEQLMALHSNSRQIGDVFLKNGGSQDHGKIAVV